MTHGVEFWILYPLAFAVAAFTAGMYFWFKQRRMMGAQMVGLATIFIAVAVVTLPAPVCFAAFAVLAPMVLACCGMMILRQDGDVFRAAAPLSVLLLFPLFQIAEVLTFGRARPNSLERLATWFDYLTVALYVVFTLVMFRLAHDAAKASSRA